MGEDVSRRVSKAQLRCCAEAWGGASKEQCARISSVAMNAASNTLAGALDAVGVFGHRRECD